MANSSSSSGNQVSTAVRSRLRPITREEASQICFSKRRSGIMKKAGELCILCRAQVLIIVFSPAGRAFSFGDPSVDVIIQWFPDPEASQPSSLDARRQESLTKLHLQHQRLEAQLEAVKKSHAQTKGKVQNAGAGELARLWGSDVNDLKHEEALQLSQVVDSIHAALAKRETDLMNATASVHVVHPTAHGHHQHFAAATLDQGWCGFMGLNSSNNTNFISRNFDGASSNNNFHHLESVSFSGASNQQYGVEATGWNVNPHTYPPTNTQVANNFYIGGSSDSVLLENLPLLLYVCLRKV